MASETLYALLSVLIVSLVSLVGALTLAMGFLRKHNILLFLVAFAAGSLLGDSFFHLLPEAVEHHGGLPLSVTLQILAGFLAFFLLEALLRWGHAHGEEAHLHLADGVPEPVAPFAWTNLVGDGIHNLIDGVLIAAAWLVSPELGIATTIAVAAHEIPQELGDFAVLVRAGLRPAKALLYNLLSALLAFAGAVIVLLLPDSMTDFEAVAVPVIAGGFLYIAAADLVPELHHHNKPKFIPLILGGLLAGLGLMWALTGIEVHV